MRIDWNAVLWIWFWSLCAALLFGLGYVAHTSSARDDELRKICIQSGGEPETIGGTVRCLRFRYKP